MVDKAGARVAEKERYGQFGASKSGDIGDDFRYPLSSEWGRQADQTLLKANDKDRAEGYAERAWAVHILGTGFSGEHLLSQSLGPFPRLVRG